MKKIIPIIVFCLIRSFVFAQNYKCIKTDAITHFINTNGNIVSIRIDSTFQNGDTTDFISYHLIRLLDSIQWNYTIKGASWIGERYRVLQNGDNIFYNAMHEPIVIKTPAYLNESWEMYRSNVNNIVVHATISNIQLLSFLGIIDSVATINFNVTNINGITIQNPLNNYALRLSKNYGLITIFNFYSFPFVNQIGVDDLYGFSDTLNLTGINNPNHGWQNITSFDIYNWQVGWEFHTTNGSSPAFGPNYDMGNYTNTIRKILNKTLTTDSIYYIMERCYYKRVYDNLDSILSEEHGHDTISETYMLNSPLNLLSYEPIIYDSNYITFHFKTSNTIQEQSYVFTGLHNDTCQLLIYDGYTFYTWLVGLGSTYNGEGFLGEQYDYVFVYYKKDSLEWGTPFVCSNLLNVKTNNHSDNDIKLYPNPNSGRFILDCSNTNTNKTSILISIIDNTGNLVYKKSISSTKYNFNVENLAKGFYSIVVQTDNNIFIKKLIIY